MDQYDYRQYDRIWERVAPTLNPYPAARTQNSAAAAPMTVQEEENLPGAEQNPCCMGSQAAESLEVLKGFIEEELADRRYYLAFARQAPNASAGRTLREIAADEAGHAKRLLAVYYLITGECFRPAFSSERISIGPWCAALRGRYHEEACGGFNYIRAAEGTTDPCLSRLLTQLSEDEYRHADRMLALLERAL
ncbi:ferritin-like domain-containing protein [Oscillibacter hominis]|uniref:Ferritin-like domain-containing protein n=1 Tax=Oscillibacter hominis TaxID=2763056 RepID=A0A7G9B281_9FIRM|nr:ferritin-like domain-containing protein [Oscillibacter hominis]QNL43662.1 ferritin-like domain-containing protein [Oscillibacter hominis]